MGGGVAGMLVGQLELKTPRRQIQVWLRLYFTPERDLTKTGCQLQQ